MSTWHYHSKTCWSLLLYPLDPQQCSHGSMFRRVKFLQVASTLCNISYFPFVSKACHTNAFPPTITGLHQLFLNWQLLQKYPYSMLRKNSVTNSLQQKTSSIILWAHHVSDVCQCQPCQGNYITLAFTCSKQQSNCQCSDIKTLVFWKKKNTS